MQQQTRLLNAPSVANARARSKKQYVDTLLLRKKCLQEHNVSELGRLGIPLLSKASKLLSFTGRSSCLDACPAKAVFDSSLERPGQC